MKDIRHSHPFIFPSWGCSSEGLERLSVEQEVASSSLVILACVALWTNRQVVVSLIHKEAGATPVKAPKWKNELWNARVEKKLGCSPCDRLILPLFLSRMPNGLGVALQKRF
jgi:hypothetical protein